MRWIRRGKKDVKMGKKIDKGEKRDKIERLRSELQERHIVSFFKNADQLSG